MYDIFFNNFYHNYLKNYINDYFLLHDNVKNYTINI